MLTGGSHRQQMPASLSEADALAFMQAVLKNSLIPVAYLDTEFRFIAVNGAYAKADHKDVEYFKGKGHFELYPHQENEVIFRQVLQTKEAHCAQAKAFEYEANPERGTTYWDWCLVPALDASANVVGLVLTLINTTTHIEAELSLQRANRALKAISAVNESLVVADDEKSFLKKICRIITETAGYQMAWVGRVSSSQEKTIVPVAQQGFCDEAFKALGDNWAGIQNDACPASEAVYSGKAVISNTLTSDPYLQTFQRGKNEKKACSSSIALPLQNNGKVLGVINIYLNNNDAFTHKEEKGLLVELADDIAFGIAALRTRAEHAEAEAQVRHSEEELRAILDSMQDTCYQVNAGGLITRVTSSVTQLLGYTPEELLGTRLSDLYVDPFGREKFLAELNAMGGTLSNYEAQLKRKDNEVIWVSTNARVIRDKQGGIVGIEGTTRNITEKRQSESVMRELSAALEQTADAVSIVALDGTIEFVNASFEKTTGYTKSEIVGQNPRILKSGQHDKKFYQQLWTTILNGDVFFDVLINRRKNGSLYYEETSITPLKNEEGVVQKFIAVGKDITERMETQQRLHYLAHHDVLTALPNRALFMDRLNHALNRTVSKNEKLAVLFLDVDRFKVINDTLGHDIGDKVLTSLAARLKKTVDKGDTIARLSGDEFAVIIENLTHVEEATTLARKILSELAEPFVIEGRALFVTTSIGISISPADGSDSQALLKYADIAMYRAKDKGRNTYQYYSADMSVRALERLSLETHLRYALEKNEFALDFQPQFDTKSNQLVGVEALLRWHHPDLGVIMPSDFISILEETGLVFQVGEWVIQRACEQAVHWQKTETFDFRMSVNISARQFSDPNLIQCISDTLRKTQLKPELLEIEITESVILRDAPWVKEAFQALQSLNVRIAIDDFGTEYSSLSYLKRFPVTTLKIDRTFVRDITTDPDDAAIIKAIIAMGKSLKLHILAEGVENQEQLDFLLAEGCDSAQGYFFDIPAFISENVLLGNV